MSLLMDALKKAEQEKKEAAKKRDILNETSISLQKRSGEETGPNPLDDIETSEQPPTIETQEVQGDNSLSAISLEDIDNSLDEHTDEAYEDQELVPEPDTDDEVDEAEEPGEISQDMEEPMLVSTGMEDLDKTDVREVSAITPDSPVELDLDQTFHGMDIQKTNSSEFSEDTVQGEPFRAEEFQKSFDETLPGVPAAQLARDIGTTDMPTPVAAQTIFSATNTTTKTSSGFKWLLISLAVIAVGSAVVFYYYSVTPVQRDIPSPIVARGVETIISSSGINNVAPAPGNTQTQASPVEVSPVPPVVEPAVDSQEVADATVTDTINEAGILQEPEGQTGDAQSGPQTSDTTDEVSDDLAVNQGLPEVIEPPTSLIKITRSQQPMGENQLVQEAFAAFQAGDYMLAESRYRQAQEQLPSNRDVMLGLAAIESKKGNSAEAINIYIQLLRQNPLDNIARAAVLGYQYGNNVTESISMIKTMVFDAPDQPLLFFTLGKLHASNTNWSEAQQAFFEAYRLDSSNPDYALNLAISLDRLGQQLTALDYYNVAVELARNNPAGFETAQVQERINTLATRN